MCKEDIFRVVSPDILEQVEIARAALEGSPKYDLLKGHMAFHALSDEADKHSVGMEINGKPLRKGRAKAIAEDALRSAREFFLGHFDGKLNEQLIKQTAYLVDPVVGSVEYRDDGLTRSSEGFVYPRNVAEQMRAFVEENGKLSNPVGQAFHSHFHIARVHPFKDGNGRLARLVEACTLWKGGYPPILIDPSERKEYIDLLRAAEESYRAHRELKPAQSRFYNFLGTKLVDALRTAKKKVLQD